MLINSRHTLYSRNYQYHNRYQEYAGIYRM